MKLPHALKTVKSDMIPVNSTMDNSTPGWIATPDDGKYLHTFGGNGWIIRDQKRVGNGPHLLLNLDLNDPRLVGLSSNRGRFLPVCSYINCDLWVQPQFYSFDSDSLSVSFLAHMESDYFVLPPDVAFEQPLPEHRMDLREMTTQDLAQTEDDYWSAIDEFLGGRSFIRVLGPAIWLQEEDSAECISGHAATYFCSIGYEHIGDFGLMGNRPFFIGEVALYFFVCSRCSQVIVKSQPS